MPEVRYKRKPIKMYDGIGSSAPKYIYCIYDLGFGMNVLYRGQNIIDICTYIRLSIVIYAGCYQIYKQQ